MDATFERIRKDLERLRFAGVDDTQVFGVGLHGLVLYPPLPEASLKAFEAQYGMELPADYRAFLAELGNGGAGPFYGVFRLGEVDDLNRFRAWGRADVLVGDPGRPFPHTAAWNDLSGMPDEPEEDSELDAFEKALDQFEKHYFSTDQVDGAIPICHEGCALRDWLVVSGPEAGHVWHDSRADYSGLQPVSIGSKERVGFLDWYLAWLDRAMATAPNTIT